MLNSFLILYNELKDNGWGPTDRGRDFGSPITNLKMRPSWVQVIFASCTLISHPLQEGLYVNMHPTYKSFLVSNNLMLIMFSCLSNWKRVNYATWEKLLRSPLPTCFEAGDPYAISEFPSYPDMYLNQALSGAISTVVF